MSNQFLRTELLLGEDGMEKLKKSRVAVFGIGGVGGYTVEALVRSGIGAIDLIDDDKVSITNINRQIYATHKTVGKYKVDVAEERIYGINPYIKVTKHKIFYMPETSKNFNFSCYDYIVDAIDTVSGKIELVINSKSAGTPIISSMGAGNKMDPTAFEVSDIYQTSVCPLARVMRQELKKRGVNRLKVVYSKEKPIDVGNRTEIIYKERAYESNVKIKGKERRQIPGSNSFVPPVVGLIIAGEVIKDLIK